MTAVFARGPRVHPVKTQVVGGTETLKPADPGVYRVVRETYHADLQLSREPQCLGVVLGVDKSCQPAPRAASGVEPFSTLWSGMRKGGVRIGRLRIAVKIRDECNLTCLVGSHVRTLFNIDLMPTNTTRWRTL